MITGGWLGRLRGALLLGMSGLLLACAHVAGPTVGQTADASSWQVAGRFAAGQLPLNGGVESDPVAGRFAWQHSPASAA